MPLHTHLAPLSEREYVMVVKHVGVGDSTHKSKKKKNLNVLLMEKLFQKIKKKLAFKLALKEKIIIFNF